MHLCIKCVFCEADTFHLVSFLDVLFSSYRRGRVATTSERLVRSGLA